MGRSEGPAGASPGARAKEVAHDPEVWRRARPGLGLSVRDLAGP